MAVGCGCGAHSDQLFDLFIHHQVPRKSDIPSSVGSTDGIITNASQR
jgi:hypothetical protein